MLGLHGNMIKTTSNVNTFFWVIVAAVLAYLFDVGSIRHRLWGFDGGGGGQYRITTAYKAIRDLAATPKEDIDKSIAAYEFMQRGTHGRPGGYEEEVEHVKNYYGVGHKLLSIIDLEKLYIPPLIDDTQGLYGNQLIWERMIFDTLQLPKNPRVLEVGCGRGRIVDHAADYTGGKVSGFNVDPSQIAAAKAYGEETGKLQSGKVDFKVMDVHEKKWFYEDNTFDGIYDFEGFLPFVKTYPDTVEIDTAAANMFRVLKPGGRFSCGDYLLTEHFNFSDPYHMKLHSLYMPTLAAMQSNYASDVVKSFEKAGFKLILSAPSNSPCWPLTQAKTETFKTLQIVTHFLTRIGLVPEWVDVLIDQFLKGGVAWNDAEKAKLVDLNWRIIVEKPK